MKRPIFLVFGAMVLLLSAFLLLMRFWVVSNEGYPTWQAVRNILIRDGEIVIILPRSMNIVSARCNRDEGQVSIDERTVTAKIEYSWCVITIDAEIDGEKHTLQFNPQKLNNWNRIRFIPVDPDDPRSDFIKFENGVEKSHYDFARSQTTNEASIPTPVLL